MPAVKFSPVLNDQIITATGAPAVGWKILSYQAGTSTPLATYTTSAGNVAHGNPEQIDTLGYVQQGPLWLESGKSYKLVLTDANDAVQKTIDNVSGVNDTSTSTSEWIDTGLTPTYISANSFSVQGDQTSTYHVGRRVKFQATGGTVYGRIVTALFGSSITTVTMRMDGTQALDSGLNVAQPSFLRADVLALPERIATTSGTDTYTATIGIARLVVGDEFKLKFANPNTSIAPTLTLDAGGAQTIVGISGAAIFPGALNGEHILRWNGTAFVLLNPLIPMILRSYFAGYGMSTAGASTTMSIAAGSASDTTNSVTIAGTVIAKTTVAWALGNAVGGLDTGTIANSTWYHFYAIRRPDTGVVDVIFSTNATTPALPTSYVHYRRIGSMRTNASGQWDSFIQDGDRFDLILPTLEAANISTTPTLRTLTRAPLGIISLVRMSVDVTNSAGAIDSANHWDPALGATLPGRPGNVRQFVNTPVAQAVGTNVEVRTNSAQQIYNVSGGTGITAYQVFVQGWTDTRGRLS